MTLSEKLTKIREYRSEIKGLYVKINTLEKEIVKEVEEGGSPFIQGGNGELEEIIILYKEKLDIDKIRDLYPSVFNYGQKIVFDWKQATLSFDNPNDFWKLMRDCKKIETTVKKEKKAKKKWTT
jgi:hypothetical protein